MSLPASVMAAETVWRYLPQFELDPDYTPVFVDLDGDGVNEIVFSGRYVGGTYEDWGSLIGVLKDGPDGLHLVDMYPIKSPKGGPVVIAGNGVTPSRLLTTTGLYSQQSLIELSGLPLRRTRSLAMGAEYRFWAYADVDADSQPEIVEYNADRSPFMVRAMDYATGSVKWERSMTSVRRPLTVAQLDDDPQLEILLPGSTGSVLDGADGSEKWSYPFASIPKVHVGRFHEDVQRRTFAVVETFGAPRVTVYQSQPYSPLWDFSLPAVSTGIGVVRDINGDGRDELITSTRSGVSGPGWTAVDMRTGQQVAQWPSSILSSGMPGAGELQAGGETLLAYGSNPQTVGSGRGMEVRSLDTGDVRYVDNLRYGPFNQVAFADLDGDGIDEKVLVTTRSLPGSGSMALEVRTFRHDGELMQSRYFDHVLGYGTDAFRATLTVADLDGQPGKDIIIGAGRPQLGSTILALDGVSLEPMWERVATSQSDLHGLTVSSLSTADFDGDGLPDVVALMSNAQPQQGRLIALSGLDGQTLWRSVAIPVGAGSGKLFVTQLDADPAAEILVMAGQSILAFDASTGFLEWSLAVDAWHASSVIAWGDGEGCRVAAVGDGEMQVYRCSNREFVEAVPLPGQSSFVRPLDSTGDVMLTASEGRLHLLRSRGSSGYFHVPITDFMGNRLSAITEHMISMTAVGDSTVDVLVGSSAFPAQIRVNTDDPLWRHGFEY